jgi:replicative DNA helicase
VSAEVVPISPDAPPVLANVELERALLGVIFVHNHVYDRASELVKPEDFHEKVHGVLFRLLGEMAEKRIPATPLSMKPFLQEIDFGTMTPIQYLAGLAADATIQMNVPSFAMHIKQLSQRRELVEIAGKLKALAEAPSVTVMPTDIITEIEERFQDVRSGSDLPDGIVPFSSAVAGSLQAIERAYEKQAPDAGKSTGFPTLDEAIGGLSDTDVIILAGRPGSGKSALAANISVAVARQNPDASVVFFSQEMSAQQIATREISKESKVPAIKLRNGSVKHEDFQEIGEAVKSLEGLDILIDGTAAIKLSQIGSKLRQIVRKKKISLVVVDYLQLLEGGGRSKARGDNRTGELTEITKGLKVLAKEFCVPFLILSQLSRECEKRDDKRPMLSDLRESGSIEQDADVVMFVYREEYYLRMNTPNGRSGDAYDTWRAEMDRWKGIAEVIVGKQRHGATGACLMGFDGETTSFRELDEDEKSGRDTDQPKAKVKLIKSAALVYDAMVAAMARLGHPGRCPNAAMDVPAILTSEAFGQYLASRPSMDGDNFEKVEKEAREQFRSAMVWLYDSGVIVISNEQHGETKRAWLYMTGRKVRR